MSNFSDSASPARLFALFKPYGYLSQFHSEDPREARKKRFLGELYDFPPGTMAVGRLDEDSEGLLLLTTDGRLSAALRSRHVEKEYYAQVDGVVSEAALAQMRQGVGIGLQGQAYHTAPCQARALGATPALPPRARAIRSERHGPTSWLAVTLTEGKYRQVRKMTAAVGLPTLRLVRVRVGEVLLADMQPGEVREISVSALGLNTLFLVPSSSTAGS